VSRTATPAPLDDRRYWRRLLARSHPDAGGSEALFTWATALRETVAGERFARANTEEPEPLPYDLLFGNAGAFVSLTVRALEFSREVDGRRCTTSCGQLYRELHLRRLRLERMLPLFTGMPRISRSGN
jgi:hypothetical protein